jgi:hypothetical protein
MKTEENRQKWNERLQRTDGNVFPNKLWLTKYTAKKKKKKKKDMGRQKGGWRELQMRVKQATV